jgi:SAM-dependent methyltransferase
LRSEFIFDQEHARRFVTARQNYLRPILHDLRSSLKIETVADVGCGVGYFSGFLHDLGFNVIACDGRSENVEEARRRYPNIEFKHSNVEDEWTAQSGSYDLVLCVGLLYHLENPLRALRNLSAMTRKLLLIESYATPQQQTTLYLREEADLEDQSLTKLALYPSESTLIKTCYRIGFTNVYRFRPLPNHEDFRNKNGRKRQRTMLLASRTHLDLPYLIRVAEPKDFSDPWQTACGRLLSMFGRLKRRVATVLLGNRVAIAESTRKKDS